MVGALMLERKGIPYRRTDLIAVISKGILRAARFPSVTVPALILDGERIQGSREIARALEAAVPDPPLFPTDPDRRAEVEAAERWGDEELQEIARRIVWASLRRDRTGVRSFLEGARLGLPIGVAAATAAPIVALSARLNQATDENVRNDIAALPGAIQRIDDWIAGGVLGGPEPNAADYQIAPSIALLSTMADLQAVVRDRPAEELAQRLVPDFPGEVGPVLPPAWLAPLSE